MKLRIIYRIGIKLFISKLIDLYIYILLIFFQFNKINHYNKLFFKSVKGL
jgi:hypothetical protein